jgi:flagellar basal-body rod modification protein FlgD
VSTGLVSPAASPEFVDRNLPAGATTLYYQVTAEDVHGNTSAASAALKIVLTAATAPAATQVKIEVGYPNPASVSTAVHVPIVVPSSGALNAYVEILDSGSRRVRHIDLGDLSAGRQEFVWDGKNDAGQVCAPGVYRGWLVTSRDRQGIRIVRVP